MILMMDLKDVCIDQSMPGRSWCKSINVHMHPYLHERFVFLLFGIARATQDLRIRNREFLVCRSMSNVSFRVK